MILNFEFEKETKNTIRFAEVDEGDGLKVGTLYLQKSAHILHIPAHYAVMLCSGHLLIHVHSQ